MASRGLSLSRLFSRQAGCSPVAVAPRTSPSLQSFRSYTSGNVFPASTKIARFTPSSSPRPFSSAAAAVKENTPESEPAETDLEAAQGKSGKTGGKAGSASGSSGGSQASSGGGSGDGEDGDSDREISVLDSNTASDGSPLGDVVVTNGNGNHVYLSEHDAPVLGQPLPWMTSVTIEISRKMNRPGGLSTILAVFDKHGINLTHIESQMNPFSYDGVCFYLDFPGREDDENVQAAIQELYKNGMLVDVRPPKQVSW
jgi:hypothetical protein